MSTTTSISKALDEILAETPPKAKRDSVYAELRSHEKSIKLALKNGWSPSQLASKLRQAGVAGSVERMRVEIMKIGGVSPSQRKSSIPKSDKRISPDTP